MTSDGQHDEDHENDEPDLASKPADSATGTTRGTIGRPTADRILDAAEALFAAHGFAGTSVRDIANAVGLNPASLYNHFANKEALYEAVLERGIRPLVTLLEEAAKNETVDAETVITAVMEHLSRTPQLPRLIHHEALSGGEHLTELARNWVRPLLVPAMAAAARKGEDTGWQQDELAPMIAAWMHMVFGHFALAPMLGELFGPDPLSPENLERQTRFLRKASLRLMKRSEEP